MAVSITCPNCSKKLRVREQSIPTGVVRCPACKSTINVQPPQATTLPPSSAVPIPQATRTAQQNPVPPVVQTPMPAVPNTASPMPVNVNVAATSLNIQTATGNRRGVARAPKRAKPPWVWIATGLGVASVLIIGLVVILVLPDSKPKRTATAQNKGVAPTNSSHTRTTEPGQLLNETSTTRDPTQILRESRIDPSMPEATPEFRRAEEAIQEIASGQVDQGGKSAEQWFDDLENGKIADHLRAADALEKLGQAAIPVLLKGIDHEKRTVKQKCIHILAAVSQEPSAHDALADLLARQDRETTALVVMGLAQKKQSPDLIIRALDNNDDPLLKLQALVALGEFGSDHIDVIKKYADGDNPKLSSIALGLLARHAPSREVADRLIEVYLAQRDMRDRLSPIIAGLGEVAVPSVLELLESQEVDLVDSGFRLLEKLGPAANSAVPVLEEIASGQKKTAVENVAPAATRALAKIRSN